MLSFRDIVLFVRHQWVVICSTTVLSALVVPVACLTFVPPQYEATATLIVASPKSVTILLGAPRSGTKLLRDILSRLPDTATWPCDEINAIWRHGNTCHPCDELQPHHASDSVRGFIRRAFGRLARRRGVGHVVEKTCANSLRPGFVNAVFPEARFVLLVRDGRDPAASAMLRWRASTNAAYVLRKARFVPVIDLPNYAIQFAASRLHRILSRKRRLSTWGPRFAGMDEILRTKGLAATCATQWTRCVGAAADELERLPAPRSMRVYYEDLVEHPERELTQLADFLRLPLSRAQAGALLPDMRRGGIGAWRRRISAEDAETISRIQRSELERHGYL